MCDVNICLIATVISDLCLLFYKALEHSNKLLLMIIHLASKHVIWLQFLTDGYKICHHDWYLNNSGIGFYFRELF